MFLPNLSPASQAPLLFIHHAAWTSDRGMTSHTQTHTQTHKLLHSRAHTHTSTNSESSHTKAWFIYHKRWIPWNTCLNTHKRTHSHIDTHLSDARSHAAVPFTSVTDGFSSSSDLNEYKYVSLTSFICQRWTHLPRFAKRGSVALCSAEEKCIWGLEGEG